MKDTELYLRTFAAMYVDGYLTEEDEVLAEELLDESPLFRSLVKECNELLSNEREEEDKEREAMLAEIQLDNNDTDLFKPQSRPLLLPWHRIAIITAIAATLVLFFIVPQLLTDSPQQLYTMYYTPEPRGRGDDGSNSVEATNQILDKARAEYYADQYANALTLLDTLSTDSLRLVPYYRGLTLLALERPKEAVTSLSLAQQAPDVLIRQNAEWYMLLSYLQANDTDNARKTAEMIQASPNHPYQKRASTILNELN